jgi:PAS domain S-box-containing protein
MKNPFSRNELAMLLIAPVVTVAVLGAFDVTEWWVEFSRPYESWKFDEFPDAIIGLAIALIWISALRWRLLAQQIKERRKVEAALRESEARFRAVYDNAGTGILLATPEGAIQAANQAFQKIVGYDEKELQETGWQKLIHPDDGLVNATRIASEIHQVSGDNSVERRFIRKSGDSIWVKLTTSYAFDDNGHPILGIAVAEDVTARRRAEETLRNTKEELERRVDQRTQELRDEITERVKAEEAVRESETKFRALIENALDFVTVIGQDGTIQFQSPSIEASLGRQADSMLGANLFEFVHPESVDAFKEVFFRLVGTHGATASIQFRALHADGSTRILEAVGRNLLHDPIVAGIVVNSRDVSERQDAEEDAKKLQNELAHVARLSTMGEMAAGFAHELNQPLTAIQNYASGSVRFLDSGKLDRSELRKAMESAASQALRAGEIIRRIRWFIRRDEPELTPVDVNAVIREAVDLMQSEAHHQSVATHLELAEDLPWVRADTIQIQQTVINLARNGIEAMSENHQARQELTIRTSLNADSEIEVSVADTGPGIPDDLRDRLFDPFFTTKSNGMGMGLAICRSIIERHGGRLSVGETEDGTEIRFTLQAFDKPTSEEKPVLTTDNTETSVDDCPSTE